MVATCLFCLGTEVPRHSAHFGTDGRLVHTYIGMYVAQLCMPNSRTH